MTTESNQENGLDSEGTKESLEILSILDSIKKLLGMSPDYTPFDPDLIILINMALNTLTQIGVGPSSGFKIVTNGETWNDFIGNDPRLESVKTYVFLKVKIVFDPPQSSVVLNCYKEQIQELEWRLNIQVDPVETFPIKIQNEEKIGRE